MGDSLSGILVSFSLIFKIDDDAHVEKWLSITSTWYWLSSALPSLG
jgi:hypothetical protein